MHNVDRIERKQIFHLLDHDFHVGDFLGDVLRVALGGGLNEFGQLFGEVVHLELCAVVGGTFQVQLRDFFVGHVVYLQSNSR